MAPQALGIPLPAEGVWCLSDKKHQTHSVALALVSFVVSACAARGVGGGAERDCRDGDVWHHDDASRLSGCERVLGSLRLGGALDSADSFRGLRSVQGSITIGPSYQLDNLAALSSLESVGGDLVVEGNWRLRGLFLGSLAHVGGALVIRNNSGLITVVLNHLRTTRELSIGGNRQLERLDLRELEPNGPSWVVSGSARLHLFAPGRVRVEKVQQKPAREERVY